MISVVVPIYNVEKYVVKCIESIVNQDYKDFELLLVDDGSKDESITLAQGYLLDKDVNYKVLHKTNGGLSSARNYGIKKAKGEYVVCIDSDDVLASDFLSKLVSEIYDCDFTFCNFKFVKEQKVESDTADEIKVLTKDELLDSFIKRTISFVVPSMLFRRDFLIDNNIFFNENTKFSEDQMFIWDVIFASYRAKYFTKQMYGYYVRDNSIMTSSSYEKIANAYDDYREYTDKLKKKYPEYLKTISYILPRWALGSLYTSARLLDRKSFYKYYDKVNGRNLLNELKGLDEPKAYLLATVSKVSKRLLYELCRKMNLNG